MTITLKSCARGKFLLGSDHGRIDADRSETLFLFRVDRADNFPTALSIMCQVVCEVAACRGANVTLTDLEEVRSS